MELERGMCLWRVSLQPFRQRDVVCQTLGSRHLHLDGRIPAGIEALRSPDTPNHAENVFQSRGYFDDRFCGLLSLLFGDGTCDMLSPG